MILVNDVLGKVELENLYSRLINDESWYLSRGSKPTDLTEGTFLGLDVYDENTIKEFWAGYFESVLFRIIDKCREQNGVELPDRIERIHLVAKQENANVSFHTDHNDPRAISLIGLLTPTWETAWGGEFVCGDEVVNHTPGSFVCIRSNQSHNGFGPNQKTPYWRIVVNYILME